jgi:hypothetical protein
MTRLIQLEERWREAEEREAELQNAPKHQPLTIAPKTVKDLVGDNSLPTALDTILQQTGLSEAQQNSFILLKSRLTALETEKDEGTLEPTAYTARLNELKKVFLNLLDDME